MRCTGGTLAYNRTWIVLSSTAETSRRMREKLKTSFKATATGLVHLSASFYSSKYWADVHIERKTGTTRDRSVRSAH